MDLLTIEPFREQVGRQFRIYPQSGEPVEVELVEANALTASRGAPAGSRPPFSLIFRGPRQVYLPQQIYRIENEQMGQLEIFLVPIGPDPVGMRFEAVFN